jgi:hypothetical protein
MKLINALYLASFFVSGALAVPTTDDFIDSEKREISTESFELSNANQPGAGNAADLSSVFDREVDGDNEDADEVELEARTAKKKRKGKKCGKKGKKCQNNKKKHRHGKKHRKGKKANKANNANNANKAGKAKKAKAY